MSNISVNDFLSNISFEKLEKKIKYDWSKALAVPGSASATYLLTYGTRTEKLKFLGDMIEGNSKFVQNMTGEHVNNITKELLLKEAYNYLENNGAEKAIFYLSQAFILVLQS